MPRTQHSHVSPFVVGVNHRSCGITLRDRLFISDHEVPSFLNHLREKGINEACVVSTCDRVEVLGMHASPTSIFYHISASLAWHGQIETSDLTDHIYEKESEAAIEHLFSVVSSLDSQMIGQPYIFSQIKVCHKIAREHGMIGSGLENLLQRAYSVAKRVRSETGVGEWSVSISAAAKDVAKGLYGDLEDVSSVLIGGGPAGQDLARQFQGEAIKHLSVYHPEALRAEAIARELGCNLIESKRVFAMLKEADVIICAMGNYQYFLTEDMVRRSLAERRKKPQFIIDTSIPGDVEPSVERLNEAFVYTLGDLDYLAHEGLNNRRREAVKAEKIIDQEVNFYLEDCAGRQVVPTLIALHQHFSKLRADVLSENKSGAERTTQLLINRLLDRPSRVLRDNASKEDPDLLGVEAVTRQLFGLDEGDENEHDE